MPTDNVAYLRNRRGGFKGRITGVSNELTSNPNITLARAKTMLETVQVAYDKFDEVQAELERTDETELASAYRIEVDQLYDEVRYKLVDIIDQLQRSSSSKTINRPKLPDLTVPKFDGNILNWLSFKGVFEEIVVKQESLDNVSKYQYLETSLAGGSAYDVIKSVSGSDFVTAWSKLETEFNHMGIIREKHVKDLYDVSSVDGTSKSLQSFLDKIESNLHSLRALEVDVDNWDLLLIHHLSNKLDAKTRKDFEALKKPDSSITYQQFKDFIKSKIRIISAMESVAFQPTATSTPKVTKNLSDDRKKVPRNKSFAATLVNSCILCNEAHSLYQCQQFNAMEVAKRQEFVRSKRICFNCLNAGHWIQQCPSQNTCRKCSKKHHTLLCKPEESVQVSASATENVVKRTALATAIVTLINPINGQATKCRAFLDCGSTVNFVTENIVQSLALTKQPSFTEVVGINNTTTINKHKVIAKIQSRTSDFAEEVELLVSRRIVGDLPSDKIDVSRLDVRFLKDLADPEFNSPSGIDILLGASVFFKVISGIKKEIAPGLYSLESQFGNLIVGQQQQGPRATAFCSIQALSEQVKKFWSLEETVISNSYSAEEKLAEKHYSATTVRLADGKYSVGLPFNQKIYELGESRTITKQHFLRQENILSKNPEKYQHYRDFINEMIEMQHLEEDFDTGKADNFITHHIISRLSSTTTKHRVVFNASMKTSTNISLNDCLLTGPTIQKPLFCHLIHWREHEVALIGDIAKMYRQIWHNEDDRNYLKIWWRPSPKDELKAYRIKTVTYGTASAPFSAIRTLFQLAHENDDNNPVAAKMLRDNFYVDDFSSSYRTLTDATRAKEEITDVLSTAGFELRKFSSNSLDLVPNSTEGKIVKTLGLIWDTENDVIVQKFDNIYFHAKLTKSAVLSEIAQIFDPLGLCSPLVLKAKLMMQKIWTLHEIKWDDLVPSNIVEEWEEFRNQVKILNHVCIPRALIRSNDRKIEMHGFSDASSSGYGAAIYLKTESGCNLVCSKSRVAPLKKSTIPRLELQAALLLARLVTTTKKEFSGDFEVFLWSDSEITLYRINSSPSRYCQFVGTRISEIQELTETSQWNFVPTHLNPADICSRGLLPSEMQQNDLWWHGPSYLLEERSEWPLQKEFSVDEAQLELVQVVATVVEEVPFINRYSKLNRLIRSTAYMRRFINLCRKKFDPKEKSHSLSTVECNEAMKCIIRYTQNLSFKDEIHALQQQKPVSKGSRMFRLNPFIDAEGIVRVGGRLQNANLSFDNQHQIILADNSHLSTLIMRHFHLENVHCGPLTLLNTSRQKFWILNGRNLAKKIVHSCIPCFKNKPVLINQIMGQIPANRLEQSRPFQHAGIDFCGYFLVKQTPRAKVTVKTYICLITCFVTRATHLEVVSDLSTEAFLAALRRFISRRGLPSDIYSDNATNFVGAANELRQLLELFESQVHQNEVEQFCSSHSINWHFIPPRSPHFGALWESAVKQAKYHLKRVMGNNLYTIEQLTTIACQIEAVLNSRPLTAVSDDPNDFKALTPGHFLIGQELNAISEPSVLQLDINRLSVYQKIQRVVQEFWSKWKHDYVNTLQCRNKWTTTNPNIKIGTLVLVSEDNIPVSQWLMGKIIDLHPGKDGIVRVATIQTTKNIIKRAIVKLAPLPNN